MADDRRTLTNRQGHPVADNQNQRTVGDRGPATLENYQFLEKISHFDRERIPERVVHARGTTSYGYFEAYGTWGGEPISRYTRAKLFQEQGKRTDVALRFHGRRRAGLLRGGARPARLRGQVLHRGRQLGPGRQQPRRLLHPRRDQVPRLHPLPEARPGHLPPGGQPAVRLHLAEPGVDAHGHAADGSARSPRELPHHARLRGQHLQVGQRAQRDRAREVPLDSQAGRRELDRRRRRRRPGLRPRRPHRGPPRRHRARRLPGVGASRADHARRREPRARLRPARRHEGLARGAVRAEARGAHGARSQREQRLRRERADRLRDGRAR